MKDIPLGAWLLKNSEPPLYTNEAADIIRHVQSGKEYLRGKFVLNKHMVPPNSPRVESIEGAYEFIYIRKQPAKDLNYGQEILVNQWFKN